jgi:hypothetical protein
MISKPMNTKRYLFISLTLILIIGACSIFNFAKSTGDGSSIAKLRCPKDDQALFSLWYSHLAVIDIDAGGGETFYLKHETPSPVFFDLWIFPDGSISNEGIIREVVIPYHGTATHPNDDDCPVQTFDGSWRLRATITGMCKGNNAKIQITEEWIDPVLQSDCGTAASPGPGLYSAPETGLVFNLNDEIPSDSLEVPEGGPFHAYYGYYLWPAGYDLPLVPLVPEE